MRFLNSWICPIEICENWNLVNITRSTVLYMLQIPIMTMMKRVMRIPSSAGPNTRPFSRVISSLSHSQSKMTQRSPNTTMMTNMVICMGWLVIHCSRLDGSSSTDDLEYIYYGNWTAVTSHQPASNKKYMYNCPFHNKTQEAVTSIFTRKELM